jgi:hypothetical protein
MSQPLPPPFRGHEGTKALKSCGIPCAVWGEDLLRHFGVPTIIFDHFLLVSNPESAASKLEPLGFHPLPLNPRYHFLEELTRNSIRLSHASGQHINDHPAVVLLPADAWHFSMSLLSLKSDIISPLSAVIESYIDTYLDAEAPYFRCHLRTHMSYLAEYVKDAKDPGFPGMLRYKYQQDFWRSYLISPIYVNKKAEWLRQRQSELGGPDRERTGADGDVHLGRDTPYTVDGDGQDADNLGLQHGGQRGAS